MQIGEGRETRLESVRIATTLDNNKCQHFRDEISKLICPVPPTEEGDTVNISYRFNIEYYGKAAEVLSLFGRLMDEGVVVDISLEELNHSHSIILSLVQQIEALRRRVHG